MFLVAYPPEFTDELAICSDLCWCSEALSFLSLIRCEIVARPINPMITCSFFSGSVIKSLNLCPRFLLLGPLPSPVTIQYTRTLTPEPYLSLRVDRYRYASVCHHILPGSLFTYSTSYLYKLDSSSISSPAETLGARPLHPLLMVLPFPRSSVENQIPFFFQNSGNSEPPSSFQPFSASFSPFFSLLPARDAGWILQSFFR